MTFYEFLQLSELEKAFELMEGVQIAERTEGKYLYILFELYSFYVEVKYNKGIDSIKPFQSTLFLEPYLAKIDISFLHEILSNKN